MKFFFSLILILSVSGLTSCGDQKSGNLKGQGRGKTKTVQRKGDQPAEIEQQTEIIQQTADAASTAQTKTETLIFPVAPLGSSATELVISMNQDHSVAYITTIPETDQLRLIAGLSGTVSVKNNSNTYSVSIQSTNRELLFVLDQQNTTFLIGTDKQTEVKQRKDLAKTGGKISFSIKENGNLTTLCLSVRNLLEKQIKVTKNFTLHPNCK